MEGEGDEREEGRCGFGWRVGSKRVACTGTKGIRLMSTLLLEHKVEVGTKLTALVPTQTMSENERRKAKSERTTAVSSHDPV
jgi:hypothetical protein